MPLRIFVDYNTLDQNGRVEIHEQGQEVIVYQLTDAMPIIVYDSDNLEFDAIAEFSEIYQAWFALPDWSTRRDLPPLGQV